MNGDAPLGKVLVVDDEPSTCRLFQIMLEADGFACEGVGSASAALDALEEGEFDVVLCDLLLGDDDGMALARRILDGDRSVGVIMITGVDDPELSEAAIEVGASGYVVKPARRSELLLSVTNALHRRKLERRVSDLETALREVDVLLAASVDADGAPSDVVASLRRLRFSG